MVPSAAMQRLFLYHLWACVPFGLAWAVAPGVLGVSRDPREILALRAVVLAALAYLALRSWVVLRRPQWGWQYVWPLTDVLLISVALCLKGEPGTSWLSLLYLLPVTAAAATLDLRWALAVGTLSAAGYLLACGAPGLGNLQYTYAVFRLFFLVLMASLLTQLARTAARAESELALSRYRSALSREMHDGIQHYLVAISTRLAYACGLLGRDPERAARLAVDQRFLVSQAADELRYLVRRLHTPALERQGFLDGLRDHLMLTTQSPGDSTGIAVSLQVEGEPQVLAPDVEQAAFRIIQESLTNARKHAQATAVTVRLAYRAGRLDCVVADDGVGFDPAQVPREPSVEGGVGLSSMQERAASVGATLHVESDPGEGTRVTFTVPTGQVIARAG